MSQTFESNPLRDPRDRRLTRIAGPSSLVFFGVTGDLARKKLLPAVYDLVNRGLPLWIWSWSYSNGSCKYASNYKCTWSLI